jgi:hypothetical protein
VTSGSVVIGEPHHESRDGLERCDWWNGIPQCDGVRERRKYVREREGVTASCSTRFENILECRDDGNNVIASSCAIPQCDRA